MEGMGTGLRHFLRLFRGVNQEYRGQYIAVFHVGHHLKKITSSL
jgi:hypothetical protein